MLTLNKVDTTRGLMRRHSQQNEAEYKRKQYTLPHDFKFRKSEADKEFDESDDLINITSKIQHKV